MILGKLNYTECFNIPTYFHFSHIARMIVLSKFDCWRDSLRNVSSDRNGTETTPFRRLIRKMPGIQICVYGSMQYFITNTMLKKLENAHQ